jgi:hypothetical protein
MYDNLFIAQKIEGIDFSRVFDRRCFKKGVDRILCWFFAAEEGDRFSLKLFKSLSAFTYFDQVPEMFGVTEFFVFAYR